ncbi:MAG: hypothetical protein ABJA83_15840 [Burkholderiaceae bacterium]
MCRVAVKCTPAQPTTTPPGTVTPPASAAPVIKRDLQADQARSRDAVTLLSDVVADASGSTGTGVLSFAIDFGDGTDNLQWRICNRQFSVGNKKARCLFKQRARR